MAVVGVVTSKDCPRCQGELLGGVFCESCGQPERLSADADHFDLLGLPRTFALSADQITSAYRGLARRIHPDRFADRSDEIKVIATAVSAQLNQAYQQLLAPVSRADYMLTLAGGPNSISLRAVEPRLLGDVMMWREEIEAARVQANSEVTMRLRNTVSTRRAGDVREIENIATQLPEVSTEEKHRLRVLLNGVKYYDNLLSELDRDTPQSSQL